MYVENGWLSLDPIYLSLLHSHKFSDNFSDMDVRAQGVLVRYEIQVLNAKKKYVQNNHIAIVLSCNEILDQ